MNPKMKNRGFAWSQRRKVDEGGRTISIIRISCRSCTNFLEKQRGSDHQQPPVLEKWFKREGWELDFRRPGSVVCPTCQKSPPASNVVHMPTPTPIQQVMKETVVNTPTEIRKAPEGAVARQLADFERDKVRDLIDQHFLNGRYIDGYSDVRVAAAIDVPLVRVVELREIAFGKIKADPELENLMAEARGSDVRNVRPLPPRGRRDCWRGGVRQE